MPGDTRPWAGTLKALTRPEPREAGDATPKTSLAAETCHRGFSASVARHHPGPARAFPQFTICTDRCFWSASTLKGRRSGDWPMAHFSSS